LIDRFILFLFFFCFTFFCFCFVFPGVFITIYIMARKMMSIPMRILSGYLVAVNVGTFALFAHDKKAAVDHQWRVRESTLQMAALAGGWVGGYAAMEMFRHKTIKQPFRLWYHLAAGANAAAIGAILVGSPSTRQRTLAVFRAAVQAAARGGNRRWQRHRRVGTALSNMKRTRRQRRKHKR
jgi:uncharacterized membrane protein YsdA (DUF1294 family)